MGGTKGSHLIIDNPALLCGARRAHDLLRERGRAHLHPVPLSRQGAGRLDGYPRRRSRRAVRCEADERDYILQSLAFVLPIIVIRTEEIVFQFAGVRPCRPARTVSPGASRATISATVLEAGTVRRRCCA
jgi:glycerol-3-phosphate dehydrogenase